MKNTLRRTVGFLGAVLMATQIFGTANAQSLRIESSSAAFEQARPATPAQKEVENLLKQISSDAVTTARHADALDSFTRGASRLQFETHASELTRAKEAINRMGADFRRLLELRPAALPWQQMVIDRMEPVLLGLAGHATEAIERLNQDRHGFPSQEYRDAVVNMRAHAGQARNLIAVNLDYAQAREKLIASMPPTLEPSRRRRRRPRAVASSSKAPRSLDQRVRSELLKLPWYGVFDYLAFEIERENHLERSRELSRR